MGRQTRWKDSSRKMMRRLVEEDLKDKLLKKIKRGRQRAVLGLVRNRQRLNTHLLLQVRMQLMLLVTKVRLQRLT